MISGPPFSLARLSTRLWLTALASLAILIGAKRRALELYEQIVALEPGNLKARATLGNLLVERGDPAGAIDQFLRLLEIHPSHADSWFNLAYIYEQRDRLDEAERCFRRSLELNDSHDRAWYGLALVLIRLERLPEAVEALRRNVKLQPFSPYGYYQLAMTHHHLGASADAWRVHEQLKTFEPRYAATLKRDLENTAPRARAAGAGSTFPPQATTGTTKEVLTAST